MSLDQSYSEKIRRRLLIAHGCAVWVEVIAPASIVTHPKSALLRQLCWKFPITACAACSGFVESAVAPYLAFFRRRPDFDDDAFCFAICRECTVHIDLRARIFQQMKKELVEGYDVDDI